MKSRRGGGVAHHRFRQQVVIRVVSVVGSQQWVSEEVVASHSCEKSERAEGAGEGGVRTRGGDEGRQEGGEREERNN